MLSVPECESTEHALWSRYCREVPPNKAPSSAPHAVYVTPQGLSGHSACSTSMFGYPIGAHDDLPSVVGISGPMEARILGAGVVPFRRVGRVRTAPLQGDLRSTGTRRTLHHPLLSLQCRDTIYMCMLSQGLSTHGVTGAACLRDMLSGVSPAATE